MAGFFSYVCSTCLYLTYGVSRRDRTCSWPCRSRFSASSIDIDYVAEFVADLVTGFVADFVVDFVVDFVAGVVVDSVVDFVADCVAD